MIVERARRRRLARAQQLATAEEDQWQAMEQVWLILQLFMSEDESAQVGEELKRKTLGRLWQRHASLLDRWIGSGGSSSTFTEEKWVSSHCRQPVSWR